MEQGIWITFEGIEGTGKSTHVERLARRVEQSGRAITVTREPGGTELGRRLRTLLLQPTGDPMHPMTELLLYAADRAQHLAEVILPALERGEVVLCDRYLDATLAYQGFGRGLGVDRVLELHRRPPLDRRPDRTVLLDLDAEQALHRARRRNVDLGLEQTEGRFEAERMSFHRAVREGYLRLAAEDPERFRVIDSDATRDVVESRVLEAVRDLLFPDAESP